MLRRTKKQLLEISLQFHFQIIAGDGKTKQFSRTGAFINMFPSLLPGGNHKKGSNNGQVGCWSSLHENGSTDLDAFQKLKWLCYKQFVPPDICNFSP